MTAMLSVSELRKMPLPDLRREIGEKRSVIAKMRIGVELRKEKDTARYRREKRELARMLTVTAAKEKQGQGLQKTKKARTVPANRS